MNVLMVSSKVKEENVADARAAVDKLFQALEQARPAGVRYATTTLGDGLTIVAFLALEPGQEHPLRTFPAYVELLESFEAWRAEPAVVERMTVTGSYGLF
jgi:hypothetical protein